MQFSTLEIPCEQFTLDNGLTVIVHEDHKTPIFAVNVWYLVGSKNEKPGRTGLAHLFEHLMFGGSEHLQGSYIEAMEKIGATDLNGTTSEDRTNYFENVPASALDYALFAESDRMGYFYSTISQEVLDLQRGVVQNEKRQSENQPYAVVEDLVVKSTYPVGHPYDHTVIGSLEDLDSASLEDVREWFKTYYTPSNAVLVVAGDIAPAEARERVQRYFADIAPGPPVAPQREWIGEMTGEHRKAVQDRVPQARLYKIWNVPGYRTPAADYLRLVSGVLSSGKTSRLYKRLVYDDQIATQVAAYLDEREIGSQFVIIATAKQGVDLQKVERAVDEELSRFLNEGPTEKELQRLKTQSYAGCAADQFALPGTARLTSALLTGGTARRSALEISDELQMLGAQLTSGCNLDLSTVYVSALKPTLREALDLYADIILHPAFPEADFERQRQLQLATIANEKVTPLQMALRALPPILYGPQHAYGAPLTGSGTEATAQKMTREDAVRFHAKWFTPNNATLIVVGDTTLAAITPAIERFFASWPTGDVPVKNLGAVKKPSKPTIYL